MAWQHFFLMWCGLTTVWGAANVTTCKTPGPVLKPYPPAWPQRFYIAKSLDTIALKCVVDKTAASFFNVTWTRNGQVLRPDSRVQFDNQKQSLVISNLDADEDTGTYRCSVKNNNGTCDYEKYIEVIPNPPHGKPSVTEVNPKSGVMEVNLGSNAYISCTLNPGSNPLMLEMQWIRNGSTLEDSPKYTWNSSHDDSRKLLGLMIHNITEQDLGQYTCFGQNDEGNDTRHITLEMKVPEKNGGFKFLTWQIVLMAVGGAFLVTVVIVPVIVIVKYRKSQHEKLDWQEPDPKVFNVPDYKLEYDVFVSYSSEDEEWVKSVLFQNLSDNGYNVNIDFKDFVPGMAIAENIMDSIYKSKKTIVVMSENFLHSMWGQYELQQAHNRAIAQRKDVLLLIKYDDCKVPGKLMGKTFLDWTDPDVNPHFWPRLFEAIGEPGDFDVPLLNLENEDEQGDEEVVKNDDKIKEEILLDIENVDGDHLNIDDCVVLRNKEESNKIVHHHDDDNDDSLIGMRISQEERMQLLV